MIVMLGVVAMLFFRARNPAMWSWLVSENSPPEPVAAANQTPTVNPTPAKPATAAAQSQHAETKAGQTGSNSASAAPAPKVVSDSASAATAPALDPVPERNDSANQPSGRKPAEKTGSIDEDPEQQTLIRDEFLAVNDDKLSIFKEEMFAYKRLMSWVQRQTFAELAERASKGVRFGDFFTATHENRGRLLRVELNVRRIIKYQAPPDFGEDVTLYEIWGWSKDSPNWMYCGVTPEIPAGMPIGEIIEERATFVGFFFKLQGYYEKGAKPRDKMLRAPLLVGRMEWRPSLHSQKKAEEPKEFASQWLWWGGAAVLFALYLGARLWLSVGRRGKRVPMAERLDEARQRNTSQRVTPQSGAAASDDKTFDSWLRSSHKSAADPDSFDPENLDPYLSHDEDSGEEWKSSIDRS